MLFKGYGAKVGLGNMRVKAENRMVTVILYLNKKQNLALQILSDAKKYIDCVAPNIAKYYLMHYKILHTILTKEDFIELYEMQQKFENMQPLYLSPIWKKFKKVYLFSDLQIWTEV